MDTTHGKNSIGRHYSTEQCVSSDSDNEYKGEFSRADPLDSVGATEMVNAAEDKHEVHEIPKNFMPMVIGLTHYFDKKSWKKKKNTMLLDSRGTGCII